MGISAATVQKVRTDYTASERRKVEIQVLLNGSSIQAVLKLWVRNPPVAHNLIFGSS